MAGVYVFSFFATVFASVLVQFSTTRSDPLYALGFGHLLESILHFVCLSWLAFIKSVEFFQNIGQKRLAGGEHIFDLF